MGHKLSASEFHLKIQIDTYKKHMHCLPSRNTSLPILLFVFIEEVKNIPKQCHYATNYAEYLLDNMGSLKAG